MKSIEERRAYMRRWMANRTPEQIAKQRAQQRRWQLSNPDKVRAAQERHEKRNPGASVQRTRRGQIRNPDKVSAANRHRKALRRKQIHPEIDLGKISLLSELCWRLTTETGREYHVDHIIPLKCGGWHHQDNLQILPGRVNIQKGDNPFWENDAYKCWRDVPRFLWPEKLAPSYEIRIQI